MLLNNDIKVYLTIEFKTPFIKFFDESEPKTFPNLTASFTTTPIGVSLFVDNSDIAILRIETVSYTHLRANETLR